MFPRLNVNLKKLRENLDAVAKLTTDQGGCSLMIVTKGMCADRELVNILLEDSRVGYLADARVKNIKTYYKEARSKGKSTVLLRLPMDCEIEDIVECVDVSFNSEISTIKLLNDEAERQGKIHKILLMIDLGDLREGLFYKEEGKIFDTASEILKLKNIELFGVGVNLTCYGAIIPKNENLSALVDIAEKIERKFNVALKMRSGGNSSSLYLIWEGRFPAGINNLRIGEAFLLGNDTAYSGDVPGTVRDAFILEAKIIELQEKPSVPIGEAGIDGFGNKPRYEDRGIIKRAILAVGKQDIDPDSLLPLDKNIDVLGASSDHMLLDVTKSDKGYKVGDVIGFELKYSGLLKAVTSGYVERVYI